jgi:hypothetical protein
MIFDPMKAEDFEFQKDVELDTENSGFSDDEIKMLAGPTSGGTEGERGLADKWSQIWRRNRQRPPEVQQLKSDFGYQTTPFITDLISVADAQGTQLEGIIKARAAKNNFYIMRCGVYISPEGGEKFQALKFEVHYQDGSASTYGMLPAPETKTIVGVSGKADLGVNGNLEFGTPPIPLGTAKVDAAVKAQLEAKFIVSFQYELKTPLVDSFGIGTSFSKWLLHKGDNLRNDVIFYPIIMTPKATTEFTCLFKAFFKIDHPDWKQAEFFLKPPRTTKVSL